MISINILCFSFQNRTTIDYEKNSVVTYIKTFEDIKKINNDVDEYVPLIPNPPSFEMALAQIHSRELTDNASDIDTERNGDVKPLLTSETPSQSNITVDVHSPNNYSSTVSTNPTTNTTSTVIFTSKSLASNSFLSLKSLYNDAKLMMNKTHVEYNPQAPITPNSSQTSTDNCGLVQQSTSNDSNTSASMPISNEETIVGPQKVRFNLEPMKLNDFEYVNERQDVKRVRLEKANISLIPKEYSLHRSPSDPTVSFQPQISGNMSYMQEVEKNSLMGSQKSPDDPYRYKSEVHAPDIPNRERKVRFKTTELESIGDAKPNFCRTLPRNHKVTHINKGIVTEDSFNFDNVQKSENEIYTNLGIKRYNQ